MNNPDPESTRMYSIPWKGRDLWKAVKLPLDSGEVYSCTYESGLRYSIVQDNLPGIVYRVVMLFEGNFVFLLGEFHTFDEAAMHVGKFDYAVSNHFTRKLAYADTDPLNKG